jgi:hypothetical protein
MEVQSMSRIILNIHDEQKAKHLLALLGDLDYVDAELDNTEKISGCPLRGLAAGSNLTVDKFLAMTHDEKEMSP